jgi:hypothetical protein
LGTSSSGIFGGSDNAIRAPTDEEKAGLAAQWGEAMSEQWTEETRQHKHRETLRQLRAGREEERRELRRIINEGLRVGTGVSTGFPLGEEARGVLVGLLAWLDARSSQESEKT